MSKTCRRVRRALVAGLLIGCGGGPSEQADAPPPPPIDSPPPPIDGPPPPPCIDDGTTGPVTVATPTVVMGYTAIEVIVHHPDGALLARHENVAVGAVMTVDVPSCGMVTVWADAPSFGHVDLQTWAWVQPGDHLVHLDREITRVDYDVRLDAAPVAGAFQYEFMGECSEFGGFLGGVVDPPPIPLTATCASGGVLDTAVVARIATGDEYAIGEPATLVAGGTTAVAFGAYQPLSSTVLRVQGDSDGVSGGTFIVLDAGGLLTLDSNYARGTGGVVELPAIDAPSGPGAVYAAVYVEDGSTDPVRNHITIRRLTAIPPSVTLDLATDDFLPGLDALVDADPVRPTVSVAAQRPAVADFVVLGVNTMAANTILQWQLVAPAHVPSFRFPELPAALAPTTPVNTYFIELVESSAIDDYEAARGKERAFLRLRPPGDFRSSYVAGFRIPPP